MRYFLPLYLLLSSVGFARNERFADLFALRQNKVIEDQVLILNGVAVHRRFIFDIYQLALYLKIPNQDAIGIIASSEIKYAQMSFLRDLTAEDLRDGFEDTFQTNCADECVALRPDMEKLLLSIPNMKKGETIDYYLYPEKTLIQNSLGISLSFEGPKFGRLFLRAWLGESPPSERFKRELLNKN